MRCFCESSRTCFRITACVCSFTTRYYRCQSYLRCTRNRHTAYPGRRTTCLASKLCRVQPWRENAKADCRVRFAPARRRRVRRHPPTHKAGKKWRANLHPPGIQIPGGHPDGCYRNSPEPGKLMRDAASPGTRISGARSSPVETGFESVWAPRLDSSDYCAVAIATRTSGRLLTSLADSRTSPSCEKHQLTGWRNAKCYARLRYATAGWLPAAASRTVQTVGSRDCK